MTRSYRTKDAYPRAFGKGMSSDYNAFITSGDLVDKFTYFLVVWGAGSQGRSNRISGTALYSTRVFEANEASGAFYKALLRVNAAAGPAMEVKTRTGQIYRFAVGAGGGYFASSSIASATPQDHTLRFTVNRVTSPSAATSTLSTAASSDEVKDFTGRSVRIRMTPTAI